MRNYVTLAIIACMVALMAGAAWRIDSKAFARGTADGDARAAAADARATNAEAALEAATSANVDAYDVLLTLKARLEQCNAERAYDVTIARAATSAAQADVERIAGDRAAMRAKMLAQQSGECREWAGAPACGSYP